MTREQAEQDKQEVLAKLREKGEKMRLTDVDALKQTFCAECDHSIKCEDCDIDYHFEHLAPTVDAVEVVRCKDCYYCATEKSFDKEYLYCDAFYEHAEGDLIGVSLMVEPNHYCSWGERKEDEDE